VAADPKGIGELLASLSDSELSVQRAVYLPEIAKNLLEAEIARRERDRLDAAREEVRAEMLRLAPRTDHELIALAREYRAKEANPTEVTALVEELKRRTYPMRKAAVELTVARRRR
jgi:hypothetical protein